MFDAYFVQQVVNGLSVGMVYALVAIGFTLIFGVLNVVNFAHGEMYTIGAFIGLVMITALSPPLWLAIVLAPDCGRTGGHSPGAHSLQAVPALCG
jgi:branched-chain amino acid transport system permease protein